MPDLGRSETSVGTDMNTTLTLDTTQNEDGVTVYFIANEYDWVDGPYESREDAYEALCEIANTYPDESGI